MRLIPSKAAVWLLLAAALGCAIALGLGLPLALVTSVAAWGAAVLLAFCIIDLVWTLRAWRSAPLQWRRSLPAAFAIGVRRTLQAELINPGPRAWRVAVFDHVDASFAIENLPQRVTVAARSALTIGYHLTARQRGPVRFEPAALRVRTRFGSAELLRVAGEAETRRVYPNFAAVARYAWLAGDQRLAEIGIRAAPQRGSGTDFKQLSEYKPGDSIRHIDWKVTLRLQRPIVREYQDERDQTVLFLLDCGRRMRADEGDQAQGGSHFDEALNALMLLAHVALKDGDAVGAMTFGTAPDDARHFAPRKGAASLNALIGTLYDIQPRAIHSDYLIAARDLMRVQRKRALIVVLTNFRDEDAGELEPALRLMRTRHLVLLASLRERALREIAEQPIANPSQAIEVAGAHLFAQSRRDAFARLAARDALLIDVEPAALPAQLVNRYRNVKRAGLL